MKRVILFSLLSVIALTLVFTACRDEDDAEYWLDYMYDRPWREKSLKTLNEIFNKTMHENGNDLKNPKVQELVQLMVPELIKGFKEFNRDKFNRTEIIKLLAQMKDPQAIPIFKEGLNLKESGDTMMFEVSANALRRMAVEAALPDLLKTHENINAARERRRAPFTKSENEVEQAIISAASRIVVKNPNTPHKAAVVKALCSIAETSDLKQELRLSMKALKGLGQIGDSGAIPTLIKGIAMKGKKQPIGMGPFAFTSLQQIHDRDAVVDAMLKFAKGKDESFNEYFKEERENDLMMSNPLWYVQETTNFFGQLAYPSKKVINFLTKELNHEEPDKIDEAASKIEGLAVTFQPEGWAMMRRNWAAVALAQLAHKPLLDTIKTRLVFKKNSLQIKPEEAVGYIRALGLLQYPESSCKVMAKVAKTGDDSLRDKTYYNASLMCGTEFTKPMKRAIKKIDCDKIIKMRFPDGATEGEEKQARNECDIMKKRITGYADRIAYGIKCGKNAECHLKTLADHSSGNAERAVYSLYRIARDDPGQRAKIVKALSEHLSNPAKPALQASIFALDNLTPKGDEELVKRIQEVYKEFARQSTYKDRARMLEAFIGHVRNRGRG